MFLMKLMKLKKVMVLHLKFSRLFGEQQKNSLLKSPPKDKSIKKCKNKINYFKNCIKPEKILPKKKWFKNFEKIWFPEEQYAFKELQNFIKEKIINYSEGRNFPNIAGTSKLSPFIKFGHLHVETIWSECIKKKPKLLEHQNFLQRLVGGFNHSDQLLSVYVKK